MTTYISKKIIGIVLVLSVSNSFAFSSFKDDFKKNQVTNNKSTQSILNLKCISQMPTTSFLVSTEKDELVLKTIHHNGTRFMPIHEGIIVPNDLTYLKDVSEILTLMGDRNEFRFPLKKCKVYDAGQLKCINGSAADFQGREMQALSFYTSQISEKAFGQSFDQIKFTLSIYVSGFVPVQTISMNYQPSECEMNF